jgi:hypothetical protein
MRLILGYRLGAMMIGVVVAGGYVHPNTDFNA